MKLGSKLVPIMIVGISFGSLAIGQDSSATKINDLIYSISSRPSPSEPSRNLLGETESQSIVEGRTVKCKEKNYEVKQRFDDFVAFNDMSDLYPGSIIQSKFLDEGKLNSIGNFKRKPISMTVTGIDLGAGNNNRTIDKPTKGNIVEELNDMIRNAKGTGSSKFHFKKVEAYSKKQALLDLGINVKFLWGGIGGNLEVADEDHKHSIFIYFKQSYYSASVEPPTGPSDFFAADVNVQNLKYRVGEGNPPGYISSVSYGRILVAKMTSSYTIDQMKSAVDAKFGFGFVKASVGVENQNVLANSQYEVYASGGILQDIPNSMDGILEFINNGMKLESYSQAVPIAFEIKYLTDNSSMVLGDETKYSIRDCFDDTPDQEFEITVNGIRVIRDCDQGTLTDTGPGEFYYSFSVNDQLIVNRSSSQWVARNDGGWIPIGKQWNFSMPSTESSSIRVGFHVVEHDDATQSEDFGERTVDHHFPWGLKDLYNFDDQGNYYYRKVMSKSGGCQVSLFYQIRKL